MPGYLETIREDFDRIAFHDDERWNHNNRYHRLLLNQIPDRIGRALDLGCGTGAFTRLLATRAGSVRGLDLSPEMINRARRLSADHPNVTHQVADILEYELPPATYDVIVSIATLHHLPLEIVLPRLRAALAPGGLLVILDLLESRGPADRLRDLVALPVAMGLNLVRGGRPRPPRHIREAWAEHARSDRLPTFREAAAAYARLLPGAKVRRHLLWRYSVRYSS